MQQPSLSLPTPSSVQSPRLYRLTDRHGEPHPVLDECFESLELAVEAAMEWLDADLAERDYVAGNRFTIADITAFAAIEFGRIVKFKPWEVHPNIARWRDAVKARPSADATLA